MSECTVRNGKQTVLKVNLVLAVLLEAKEPMTYVEIAKAAQLGRGRAVDSAIASLAKRGWVVRSPHTYDGTAKVALTDKGIALAPGKIGSPSVAGKAPRCFDSQADWHKWTLRAKYAATPASRYCEDCTEGYKARMMAENRCDRPYAVVGKDETPPRPEVPPIRPLPPIPAIVAMLQTIPEPVPIAGMSVPDPGTEPDDTPAPWEKLHPLVQVFALDIACESEYALVRGVE